MERFDIGFLGGGQLARMSIQAAQRMGLTCLSLDPAPNSPAAGVAKAVVGSLSNPSDIAEIARACRFITLENEFIPATAIREGLAMADRDEAVITPRIDALATIQDKLHQREALAQAGVPGPKALAITEAGLESVAMIGFPMVLKARFGGYDGKGTRVVKTPEEFQEAADLWRSGGWMAEEFVPFAREVSQMVAVCEEGSCFFPFMETIQLDNVCEITFPAEIRTHHSIISSIAQDAIRAIGGKGLFGVECFELEDGTLTVNEIAPRPHNTGHYSLNWDALSQFDAHIRAVMGWKLPAAVSGSNSAMVNLLGQINGVEKFASGAATVAGICPEATVHWYGKASSKVGRKMGHLNWPIPSGASASEVVAHMRWLRDSFYEGEK